MTFCNDSNVVEPILAWTPTIAVSGIDYYNHPMFPNLQGCILMTTLKNRNLHILKLNSTFDDVVSDDTLLLVNGDRLRDICIDPDGRIYISTSNSTSSGSGFKRDKIIEIYDPSYISVGQINEQNTKVNIYPNPAGNMLNVAIQVGNNESLSYIITALSGQLLTQGHINRGTNMLDISMLSNGSYHLQIYIDKKVIYTGNFLKQ